MQTTIYNKTPAPLVYWATKEPKVNLHPASISYYSGMVRELSLYRLEAKGDHPPNIIIRTSGKDKT